MSECSEQNCKRKGVYDVRFWQYADGVLAEPVRARVCRKCAMTFARDRNATVTRHEGRYHLYRRDRPRCDGAMRNGRPCSEPAAYLVRRTMSGTTAVNCYAHTPGTREGGVHRRKIDARQRQRIEEAGIAHIELLSDQLKALDAPI